MAPPTNKPRLSALDPSAVAAEAVQLVRDHMTGLAFGLSPGVEWREMPEPRASECNLAWTVALLTRYAQTGDTADWGSDEGALDAMQEVCAALYSQAGRPGTFDVGDIAAESDPDTAIGLVLLAAMGRCRLAERKSGVSPRELAALADLSTRQVQQLASKGEIRAENGIIPRSEARRWLSGRGVAGF